MNVHTNKYVRPRNIWTAMYIGHVVCCPLVSHVEYAQTEQSYAVQCVVDGEENPFHLRLRHPTGERPSHGDRQHAKN